MNDNLDTMIGDLIDDVGDVDKDAPDISNLHTQVTK